VGEAKVSEVADAASYQEKYDIFFDIGKLVSDKREVL
jgi:hypothetical protein